MPTCAATQLTRSTTTSLWWGVLTLPAGTYDYKITIDGSFDESYPTGQITLSLPAARTVRIYYDEVSHRITDNVNDVIATVIGSFQSELGCPGDWNPTCQISMLADVDGDGISTFLTTVLPAGSYDALVAIDEGFDVLYGAGGQQGGANLSFFVPADGSLTSFSFSETTKVSTIASEPARLRVTTSPALPADIVVDGVARDRWGLNWAMLPPGPHQVCFGEVPGRIAPACQTITLVPGATTTVTGTYTQNGYLRVITSPAVASTISVDGVARNDWGLWAEVAPGTHTVCFGPAAGFAPPACREVAVAAGATATTTGSFVVDAAAPGPAGSFGYLRATTSPALAAMIRVDGAWRNNWGLDWLKLPVGPHQVCFGPVPDRTAPACTTATVVAAATATATGSFGTDGFLRVLTSPALPASITVDGQVANSFGVWTAKAPGSHHVCFGVAAGYVAPPCQDPVVSPGATTTVTGTYVPVA